MNIPRQAPARIPKKLYLFPIMLLPKGKENLALTANTLKHWMMKMERYTMDCA